MSIVKKKEKCGTTPPTLLKNYFLCSETSENKHNLFHENLQHWLLFKWFLILKNLINIDLSWKQLINIKFTLPQISLERF